MMMTKYFWGKGFISPKMFFPITENRSMMNQFAGKGCAQQPHEDSRLAADESCAPFRSGAQSKMMQRYESSCIGIAKGSGTLFYHPSRMAGRLWIDLLCIPVSFHFLIVFIAIYLFRTARSLQ